MGLKFGTSGLRGLAVDLLGDSSAVFTTAFVRHLLMAGHVRIGDRIFVGRDLRESSPGIAAQCMKALALAGMVPVDCGALPTPALALHAGANRAAAIMVTGSHIPADRNGLKFYRPDGEIDKTDEASITMLATEPVRWKDASSTITPYADEADAAWALYRNRCLNILPADALSGLRIGVYQHSSVARDFLVELLSFYGAEVLALGRSEAFVAVDTEAVGEETAARLKDWTHEHHLHAIVSTDADADRPLVIDETGRQIRGDTIGLVTARLLHADCVVTPITSNSGIDYVLGAQTIRTRVGSPYVIEAMLRACREGRGVVTGFEANGGFILGSPVQLGTRMLASLPTRDAMLPILALLGQGRDALSRHVDALKLPVCMSDRLMDYSVEASRTLMAWLAAERSNIVHFLQGLGTVSRVDSMDGLRIVLDDGSVVHLRPSGNAPEMRCYVEAATSDVARWLLSATLARVHEHGQSRL